MLTVPGGVRVTVDHHIPGSISARRLIGRARFFDTTIAELAICAAAFAVIVAFGLIKLPMPLHRDTATFLWMASLMDQGAVLYADVWDVKQPGIFLFNWVAGKMFGFTAEGVHLFELIWQLVFAAVVILALRPLLRHRWLAPLAPLAILASYWAFCEPHQQTQLEILVGLPLLVVAWISTVQWRTGNSCAAAFLLAGIAAGVATMFKHLLAPIPVAFLLAASIGALRTAPGGAPTPAAFSRVVVNMWLPFATGVILVWGLTAAAFWRLDALDDFIFTNFLYPVQALGDVTAAPLSRLGASIIVCVASLAPWLLFAALAVPRLHRADEPVLFRRMAVWLIVAIPIALVQKNSWWAYHTLLFYTPVCILAARGVDLVVSRLDEGQRAARRLPSTALAALLVLPALGGLAFPTGQAARGPLTGYLNGDLENWRRTVSEDYAQAADAAAFMREHAPPGPVYVFGDPTIMLLAPRPQAIAPQGSAWAFYLLPQWATLADDLRAARPVWVFVEEHQRGAIEERSPETLAWLAREYRLVWDTPYGQWYARAIPGGDTAGGATGT